VPHHNPSHARRSSALPRSYNLTWHLLRPFASLILQRRARRGKEDPARLGERLGRYQTAIPEGAIWLHAVSVGEAVAALALTEQLHEQMPEAHFLITTNTVTAAGLVAKRPDKLPLTHLYQPLDHPQFVDRFLSTTKPRAAIFLESDFWPNLITRTSNRQIPVILASAQMSDTAFDRWQRRKAMAKIVFGSANLALAVNQMQAERLAELGVCEASIHVLGSLKLPADLPVDPVLTDQLRRVAGKRQVLLAASTHEGEDEFVLAAMQHLGDEWFTIIAPRHPNRGSAIAELAKKQGFRAPLRSQNEMAEPNDPLYIADTLGEMGSLFSASDTVFLGGSLRPLGGHNPLEPARFGLPVITGPHIAKNSAEFEGLAQLGAVTTIHEAPSLAGAVQASLDNAVARRKLAKAVRVYAQNAGKRASIAAEYVANLLQAEAAS